jgi:hypothetical protein
MADTGDDGTGSPSLVVVTTDPVTTRALSAGLERQLPSGSVAVRTGFYATVSALARHPDVLIADIGAPNPRDEWRLAELRTVAADSTIVVVADATVLPRLAGPLRPDLCVRSVDELPPLRELLTGPAAVDDQTMRRRSRR